MGYNDWLERVNGKASNNDNKTSTGYKAWVERTSKKIDNNVSITLKKYKKSIDVADALKTDFENFVESRNPATANRQTLVSNLKKDIQAKTTIPSVDYDAGYVEEQKLKAEAEIAKKKWQTAGSTDIKLNGLNISGASEKVKELKRDYENKNKIYQNFKSNRYYSSLPNGKFKTTNPDKKNYTTNPFSKIDWRHEYINNSDNVRKYIDLNDSAGEATTDFKKYSYMTEREIGIYNYIYNSKGKDKAEEYLDFINDDLETRQSDENIKRVSEFADKHYIAAAVASPFANVVAAGEQARNMLETVFTGEVKRNSSADTAQILRSGLSEKVDLEIGSWDAFDFVYNTVMSGVDSALVAPLGTVGAVGLGLSAAASTTNDILDRGGTDEQAFWGGLVSGAFEGFFEWFSIGQLKVMQEGTVKGFKDFAKNVGKSMLTNASEETATEAANVIYDYAVNGGISNYSILVQRYMNSGYSESEAKKEAAKTLGLQIVEAGASGALMGFGFGSLGSAAGYSNYRKYGLNDVITRLSNDEDVDVGEITKLPQIKKIEQEIASRPETNTINTPERLELRSNITNKLLQNGSATIDSNGNVEYNGIVKQERRADIVIGLSAAGKSSVLVNPLSEAYSSRVIDSDMAKEEIPEFDNGLGANAVHQESKGIVNGVIEFSVANGDNIVYPIVGGGSVNSLIDKIQYFKDNGYSVHLHLNELSNNKALGRSLNRYIETGRYIPPDIIKTYGNTPTENFNIIINTEGLVDGYTHYSNDVAKGERPTLIKASENDREFDGRQSRLFHKTQNGETSNTTESVNNKATSDTEAASFMPENSGLQSTTEAGSGIIKGKPSRGPLNKAEQDYILKVAKALGREVKFVHLYDELKAMGKDVSNGIPDGAFDNRTGVIYIDFAAKDPILFVFKHELTHFTENTEQYDKFVKAVKKSKAFHEWLRNRTKLESNDVEALIEKYQMIISEVQPKGINLDAEMYADFVGDVLFRDDGSKLESLLSGLDYKERNAFVQFIRDFVNYLKKKFAGQKDLLFEISRLEDNFNRALSEATATKKFPTNGGGVQYDINAVNITEADIKQNIADIVKMKSVSEMSGNEFSKGAKDLVTQVDDYFATFGYSVENSVLGDVDITARGAKDSIAHGIGRKKAVAFAAVPKVIESGKIIDYQTNWKNRGYDTVVLAAPVTINNTPYYEGVIVIRDSKTQRFYVHEVITEKRTDMSFKTGADNKIGKSGDTSSPSILSLLDKIRVVKENLATEQADNNRDTAERAGGVDNNSGLSPTDNVSTDSIPDNQESVNNNSMQKSGNNSKNDLQFSFGLETRQKKIDKAEELERKGANRHEIWNKVRIIRDAKGKWVREINDKYMVFRRDGDAAIMNDPDYDEYIALKKRSYLSDEDYKKLGRIDQKFKRKYLYGENIVGNYVQHDELFKLYPQLYGLQIEFEDLGSTYGKYVSEERKIVINKSLIDNEFWYDLETTIMHELQHAIQDIDERATGASIEYWSKRAARGDIPLDENGKPLSPRKAYENTAGEIEARQTESRKSMSDYKRKKNVPDFGWDKAVFVEEKYNLVPSVQYSIPSNTDYISAVESGDLETAQRMTDEAAKAAGYTERLYHQTGADFTEFNTENQKAGKYDWELPTGTFLKPTSDDIGLSGKKQMELYAKFQNPLKFKNRAEAQKFWKENVEGYAEAVNGLKKVNAEYREKVDNAEAEVQQYINQWRNENPDASRREIYNDPDFQKLYDKQQDIVDEWDKAEGEASTKAKELIDSFIAENDYDGIILERDDDGKNRHTKSYIAFESAQMKSAEAVTYDDSGNVIPLGERFNAEKSDIRYSVPNEMRTLFNRYNSGEITAEQYEAGVDEFWNKTIAKMEDKALAQSIENMRELAKIKEKNKKNSQKLSYRNRQIKRKNAQLKKQRAELKLYNEKVTPYGTVSFGKNLEITKNVLSRIKTRQQMNSDKKHIPELLKPYANLLLRAFSREYPMPFNKESIESLKGEYLKLSAQIGFDPEIAEILDELSETIDGKTIKEIGFCDLYRIRQVAENCWHMIQEKEEVFLEGKKQSIKEVGDRALTELSQKKVKRGNFLSKTYEFMMYNNTLPIYYFERIGGVFKGLFDTLMDGEDTNQRNVENAKTYFNQTQDKYNYSKWKDDDIKPIVTERGKKVHLSVEQTMLLYATYKREKSRQTDQTEHILEGGITVPNRGIMKDIKERFKDSDKKGFKRLYETFTEELYTGAISITEKDVAMLVNQLTQEQKAYADTIVKYLSEDMAALGNQTSMEFFGYCKYNETYYIPFCSDKNYLNMQISTMDGNHWSLKHSSFTHNLSKGAKTPLVMGNFSEVCADHMNKMCRYNASAVTLDAMLKVLNYQSDSGKSVSAEIKSVYGEQALNYLIDFLRKMNGTIDKGISDGFIDKLIGLYRKNSVSASLSVAVQQPSSLPRAWLEINPKYFVRKSPKSDYEEMLKYCPVGGMKERGRVDIGTGAATVNWILNQSPDTIAEKTKALADVKDSSYRDDKFMRLAAKGDEWTWKHIWTAVKRETTAKTKLKAGTDEFYEACNKRFRYIINKTQVYDSPMSKSKIMSGGPFGKMFTAFAAEPTVWANALMNMNKKTAAKTISIFILAGALNAALKSLVTAPRDDDEDKTYWEKYSEDFWEGFLDNINPATHIPILRDAISITKGYDVERPDMSAITDLVDAFQALSSDKKSTYRKIEDFAGALAAFAGLPVKNIMRDVRAAYNFYTDMFVNDNENREVNSEVAGYMDELYDNDTFKAFEDEDKEKLEEKITDTVKNVQKAQENKTALQDFDELYELLRKNKSDYNKARQKMIDEGRYTADEITNGVEIARVAYMKSLGIDVGEYLLYKIATSKKYADTNKSGGVNTEEKEAAIDNLDLDSDTKNYFKKKHK